MKASHMFCASAATHNRTLHLNLMIFPCALTRSSSSRSVRGTTWRANSTSSSIDYIIIISYFFLKLNPEEEKKYTKFPVEWNFMQNFCLKYSHTNIHKIWNTANMKWESVEMLFVLLFFSFVVVAVLFCSHCCMRIVHPARTFCFSQFNFVLYCVLLIL